MRLSISSASTRVGNVELYETFRVTELDAGCEEEIRDGSKIFDYIYSKPGIDSGDVVFFAKKLRAIEKQLAIIVPCMNEEQHLLEGVLRGIPNHCLIILISNSNDSNFQAERKLLAQICHENKRPGIVVHQQDEALAGAFAAAGMTNLVEETNRARFRWKNTFRIRKGKGEAMMIGVAIAKLSGKHFVGFIDADNWVPGSVQEYCKVYAAGIYYALHGNKRGDIAALAPSIRPNSETHAMVRIKWNQKPKVQDGKLVSKDSGRCSIVVNQWMNRLLNAISDHGVGTERIQTANAGEHAMSIDFALQLQFATGYAVEPFQFINAWERFGLQDAVDRPFPRTKSVDKVHGARSSPAHISGTLQPRRRTSYTKASAVATVPKVKIVQIRTCNPHIHDFSKGDGHIENMQIQGLSTIYYSRLTPQKLKDELRLYMRDKFPETFEINGEPPRPFVYPALQTMDWGIFRNELISQTTTLEAFGSAEHRVM